MNNRISVCIPSYNHEKFIAKTIESILGQSFQDFELIISDDNSNDNTVAEIKKFNDKRIKLIENKVNNGPSINTNIAIRNASCDLVSIIASDDVMQKDRLQKSHDFMMENSCDAVFTFINIIDKKGNICANHPMVKIFNQNKNRIELLQHFFYRGNFLCAPSATIRKSVFENLGFMNPCLLQLQDFDLWTKMAIKNYKILFLEEKLTHYRVHNENLSALSSVQDFYKLNSRYYIEHSMVLENFLKISFDDFLLIFKDELKNFPIIKEEYISFYLAAIAYNLSQDTVDGSTSIQKIYFNKFAIETMVKIFSNELSIANLYKDLNFTFKNFIDMVSNNLAIKENCYQKDRTRKKKSLLLRFKNSCAKRIARLKKH